MKATIKIFALQCGCLLCGFWALLLIGSLIESLTPSPFGTIMQLVGIGLAGLAMGDQSVKEERKSEQKKMSRCTQQLRNGSEKGCTTMTTKHTILSDSFYHGPKVAASGSEIQQQSLTHMMEGMDHKKRVNFCLYKIADLCGLESPLKVQDYWPMLATVDKLPPYELEALDKKLTKELNILENMGEWAHDGLTLRDKIGFYYMALKRMEDWPAGRAVRLDQPCTWAQFRKIISEEVNLICHDE